MTTVDKSNRDEETKGVVGVQESRDPNPEEESQESKDVNKEGGSLGSKDENKEERKSENESNKNESGKIFEENVQKDRESKEEKEGGEPKAGESQSKNVIIQDEDGGGGEFAEKKGWCRTPVGRRKTCTGQGQDPLGGPLSRVQGGPVPKLEVLMTSTDKSTDF